MNKILSKILLLISYISIASCSSKGDYTSPFFKTYELVSEKDTAILYLQRTIEKASEYDSNEYNIYQGKIMLSELQGAPKSIAGTTVKGEKQVRLTFEINKQDTLGFLNLTINGDGTVVEGWKGLQMESKGLPDSIRFKGRLIDDKNAKVIIGLKSKEVEIIVRKYSEEEGYWDEVPQKDTIQAQYLIQGNMDSLVFQEMMDDINASEKSGDLSLLYKSDNILSLERYHYEEGGAHSLFNWYYFNYDLNTGKRLKLLNVFQSNAFQNVADAVNSNLKKQLGLKPNQSLKVAYYNNDYIGVSKNFFITNKGIGFQYNIYEIASFASGPTTVFVPYKDIEEFLNPDFKMLIGNNTNETSKNVSKKVNLKDFEGKWTNTSELGKPKSQIKSWYLKKEGDKYKVLLMLGDDLVESDPDGYFYYDSEKRRLTRNVQGSNIIIEFENKDTLIMTISNTLPQKLVRVD